MITWGYALELGKHGGVQGVCSLECDATVPRSKEEPRTIWSKALRGSIGSTWRTWCRSFSSLLTVSALLCEIFPIPLQIPKSCSRILLQKLVVHKERRIANIVSSLFIILFLHGVTLTDLLTLLLCRCHAFCPSCLLLALPSRRIVF
jgi:hypothetical protein